MKKIISVLLALSVLSLFTFGCAGHAPIYEKQLKDAEQMQKKYTGK